MQSLCLDDLLLCAVANKKSGLTSVVPKGQPSVKLRPVGRELRLVGTDAVPSTCLELPSGGTPGRSRNWQLGWRLGGREAFGKVGEVCLQRGFQCRTPDIGCAAVCGGSHSPKPLEKMKRQRLDSTPHTRGLSSRQTMLTLHGVKPELGKEIVPMQLLEGGGEIDIHKLLSVSAII